MKVDRWEYRDRAAKIIYVIVALIIVTLTGCTAEEESTPEADLMTTGWLTMDAEMQQEFCQVWDGWEAGEQEDFITGLTESGDEEHDYDIGSMVVMQNELCRL